MWRACGDGSGVKQRLLNLLTALSLLLCVAVCVLWVRSYSWQESFAWTGSQGAENGRFQVRHASFNTGAGRVSVRFDDYIADYAPDVRNAGFRVSRSPRPKSSGYGFSGFGSQYGFGVWRYRIALGGYSLIMGAPYWSILPLLLFLPAVRLGRKAHQRRRQREGICPS